MSSEDNWEPAWADNSVLVWSTVPGTNVKLQLLKGWPAQVMLAFAADFNAYVESLRDDDSAGYTPTNSVSTSNHLNGTAMDLNWNSHPFHVKGTFNPTQVATIRELLTFYEGTIYWAGDWTDPIDEMHWQMGYETYNNPATGDFITRKIRPDGLSTFRRDVPVPTPAPAPTDPAKVLCDAVPVIQLDRAQELVSAVMAGLALAQCNNPQRIAMALAQWGEESDGFATTEEYAKNGRYAPYIGRTWIMITWQSNYAAFGSWCVQQGLITDPNQFVNDPESLADLKWAGIGAAWYWTVGRPNINSLSDDGDVVAVTQLINGGQNGIADRTNRYNQAIALGDRLLALVTSTPALEGPLMALTDDEQQELLTKVREVWDQVRGPGGSGWPQLSGLTPVDALATLLQRKST